MTQAQQLTAEYEVQMRNDKGDASDILFFVCMKEGREVEEKDKRYNGGKD